MQAELQPSNIGPPGREHLGLLPPPSPQDDVANRKLVLPPPRVRRAVRAVAEALFDDETPPDPARLDWAADDFLRFMVTATGRAHLILRASLFALTWLTPLFVFTPLPFAWLPVKRRVLALERMEHSPLGPAALAVKAMLCMIWFEHPDTQTETRTVPACKEVA